jgi:diguanylate cyclase
MNDMTYILLAAFLIFSFFCIIFFLEKVFYQNNKEKLYRFFTAVFATSILWFIYISILSSIDIAQWGDFIHYKMILYFIGSCMVLYITIEKVGKIERDMDTIKLLKLSLFMSVTFLGISYLPLIEILKIRNHLELSLAFALILMMTTIFLVMRVIQQMKIDIVINKRKLPLIFQLFIALLSGLAIIGWYYTFLYLFVEFNSSFFIVAEFVSIFLLIATTIIYAEDQYKYKEEQLKKNNKRLSYMAYHDQMTNLPNRAKIIEIITSLIEGKERFAMLFIDLDDFKFVNDLLSHKVGDILLVRVTQRLRTLASEDDSIGRIGGDEFVLIKRSYKDREELEQFVDSVQQSISKTVTIDNYPINITPSIGIVEYPDNGERISDLLKSGDIALLQAKSKGRNAKHYFSNTQDQKTIDLISLREDLKLALERNQLEVYYQPQIDLKKDKVKGFEALLRWNHPKKGIVSPATFIPIAEETGIIAPIGEWVLREACKQVAEWNKKYNAEYRISVNLSLKQLYKNDFVTVVEEILQETQLPESLLELEITESVAMADVNRTKSIFKRFHELGVRLSLDDFGTGYSSLSFIQQFKISRIKIDRSFLKEINVDSDDYKIVSGILSMALQLNLLVTAEGIETIEQLEYIRQNDCHEAQGFYFSKPMPPADIEKKVMNL